MRGLRILQAWLRSAAKNRVSGKANPLPYPCLMRITAGDKEAWLTTKRVYRPWVYTAFWKDGGGMGRWIWYLSSYLGRIDLAGRWHQAPLRIR